MCNFEAGPGNQQLLPGPAFDISMMEIQFELWKQRVEKGDTAFRWDLARCLDEGELIGRARWPSRNILELEFEWECFVRSISVNRRLRCGMNALRSKGARYETIISLPITKRGEVISFGLQQLEQCFSVRAVVISSRITNAIVRTGNDW